MKHKYNYNDNSAVIYARFSSHNQRDESIDAQERACRDYAKRKGLNVIEFTLTGQNQAQMQNVMNFKE